MWKKKSKQFRPYITLLHDYDLTMIGLKKLSQNSRSSAFDSQLPSKKRHDNQKVSLVFGCHVQQTTNNKIINQNEPEKNSLVLCFSNRKNSRMTNRSTAH